MTTDGKPNFYPSHRAQGDACCGYLKVANLRHQLSAARERIAELEAVVERLPKTADGVPVTPGMKVWDAVVSHTVTKVRADSWEMGGWASDTYIPYPLYSTREAAKYAKEEYAKGEQIMIRNKYKEITKKIDTDVGVDSLTFDELRKKLNKYEQDFPDYYNFQFLQEFDWDYSQLTIEATRKETDEERNKRLAKERKEREKNKKEKEAKEAKDKERLKKLANKLGYKLTEKENK